jgi:hypothetical protein
MQVKVSKQNLAFYPIMGLDTPIMCHYLCRPHKTYEIYDRCLKMIVKERLASLKMCHHLLKAAKKVLPSIEMCWHPQKELLKNVLAFLKRAVKKVLASLEMCWHFLRSCYNF